MNDLIEFIVRTHPRKVYFHLLSPSNYHFGPISPTLHDTGDLFPMRTDVPETNIQNQIMFSVTHGPSFPFASRSIISVAPNFLISCSTQSNRKYLHRYRKICSQPSNQPSVLSTIINTKNIIKTNSDKLNRNKNRAAGFQKPFKRK